MRVAIILSFVAAPALSWANEFTPITVQENPEVEALEEDIATHREEISTHSEDLATHREIETSEAPKRRRGPVNLSGPRIGVTYILGKEAELLEERLDIKEPIITQFGWQFEHRFFEQPGGFSGINEFLFLVGGLDQAAFLPTFSWIIGVRSSGGIEVGAGPVISFASMVSALKEQEFGLGDGRSLAGLGFALAAGVTLRAGEVNFPINLAAVRSDSGFRLSLLAGFNLQSYDDEEAEEKSARKSVHDPEPAYDPLLPRG